MTLNDKMSNSVISSKMKSKSGSRVQRSSWVFFCLVLVREGLLLSKNTGDPTVGGLRGEKEKRSMQSRLRVDPGIESF